MESQRSESGSEEQLAVVEEQSSGSSVGELVRRINDAPTHPADGRDKRGRSESGDLLPAGKRSVAGRGELGRSPGQSAVSVKERVEITLQDFESKILSSISKDLHELRVVMQKQLDSFETRIKELENHVEERDSEVECLRKELGDVRREMAVLQGRAEDAELNSRLPCLILSGEALAPSRGRELSRSRPGGAGRPASGPGPAPAVTSIAPGGGESQRAGAGRSTAPAERRPADSGAPTAGSADRPPAPPGPAAADRRGTAGGDGGRGGEREDIHGLVVSTLNRCLPGLNMCDADIDRAHRLPGAGNRIIVRFVHSGRGSIRDQVYWRRLSLRGRDLFISESLTRMRGVIFRSLLSVKKQGKIHTVFTRGGQVFFKSREYGTAERVDSIDKVRQLGYPVTQ